MNIIRISFCSLFYILIKVQIEQRSILYLNPGFWTWFTQQVPLVEQELHTLQRTWGHLRLLVWCNSIVSFLCSVLLALFVYSWFFFRSYSQTCHVITSFDHTVKPAMWSPLLIIQSNLPCDHLFSSYSQTCHAITSFDHTVKPAMPSPLLIIQSNLPCDHLFWSYSQICHTITSFKLSHVFKGNLSYKEIVPWSQRRHHNTGLTVYFLCTYTWSLRYCRRSNKPPF